MNALKKEQYYKNIFDMQAKEFKKRQNPVYIQGYEQARKDIAILFSKFLDDRMNTLTEIKGIGSKTADKIFNHFMEGVDDEGESKSYPRKD